MAERKTSLWKQIKADNGYSDREIKQIKYVLSALFSDFSKLFLMGILFFILHKFPEYIGAVIVLLFIRTNSGGLHFNHYTTCLLFSFLLLFSSVILLPDIVTINKLFMISDLTLCIFISFLLNPVRCVYRPAPDRNLIRMCHINTFKYIFIFLILSYALPLNSVIISGFWTINLQMLQLIAANIWKKGDHWDEKTS